MLSYKSLVLLTGIILAALGIGVFIWAAFTIQPNSPEYMWTYNGLVNPQSGSLYLTIQGYIILGLIGASIAIAWLLISISIMMPKQAKNPKQVSAWIENGDGKDVVIPLEDGYEVHTNKPYLNMVSNQLVEFADGSIVEADKGTLSSSGNGYITLKKDNVIVCNINLSKRKTNPANII